MTLTDHLRAIVRYWYVLLVLLIVGAVVAVVAVAAQSNPYESKFRLAIGPKASVTGSTQSQVMTALSNVAVPASLAQIASSDSVKKAAITAAGVSSSGVSTTAAVANNSYVIEVGVRSDNKADAAKIAESISQQAITQFEKVYTIATVTQVDVPSTAKNSRPSTATVGLLGAVLGLLLGYLIALGLASLKAESDNTGGRRHGAGPADGFDDELPRPTSGFTSNQGTDVTAGGRAL